jgi:hypothetical protein
MAGILVDGSLTAVHGEFYPQNILIGSDQVYSVDWQSAAIARGEIDLASLTEGWSNRELVRQCELTYKQARWPQGAPGDFESALSIARVYWPLRWLGDEPEWAVHRERRWYFDYLRESAEVVGII